MRHTINRLAGFSGSFSSSPDETFAGNTLTNQIPGNPAQEPSSVSPRRSLKAVLPKARFFAGEDIAFDAIAGSAEDCREGQLVVYRMGIDCPLETIAAALARGAAGILTEQVLPSPLPQCIVGDTDRALSHITSALLTDPSGQRPDQQLLTIGVVGGSGKTTTALAIAAVLKDAPCRVAYHTDLGESDGIVQIANRTTSPHVIAGSAVQHRLSESAEAGAAVQVMELDDTSLKAGSYDAVQFDLLVITNRSRGSVGADHDFGPSPIDLALEQVRRDGVVIVPASEPGIASSVTREGYPMVTYGVDAQADITLKTVSVESGVLTAVISHDTNSAILESTLGRGTLSGSLAAATAVGVLTENPLVQIAESLGSFRGIPGRMQTIDSPQRDYQPNQVESVLDAGGDPSRLEFVLQQLRGQLKQISPRILPMRPGVHVSTRAVKKLWCVLAVDVTDCEETLANYGRLLESLADHSVLTCQDAGKREFLRMSHGVLDGVENCAAMRLVADQKRAIAWAHQAANPGDMVVVIGGLDRTSQHGQRESVQVLQATIEACQVEPAEQSAEVCNLKVFNPID